jgi:UDPglucose--hexose-1-phosphate uridylyltransferase
VVIAPARRRRPGARPTAEVEPDDPARCPFCEGHEGETPPETFAIAPLNREPDTPGWQIRVVPNKFPAFGAWPDEKQGDGGLLVYRAPRGRQEVVVNTPRHVRSLAELDRDELARVARAWQERAHAAHAEGFPYVHALVNEGRNAGASLPHSHSQLLWLPELPPLVLAELKSDPCVLCRLLEEELATDLRVVARANGLALLCAYAARSPYELLVAPLECERDPWEGPLLGDALALVAEGLGRIHALEGEIALNLWLHAAGHWHIEVLPRLSVFAGVELGAGYFVCSLAPERAAVELRAAETPSSGRRRAAP